MAHEITNGRMIYNGGKPWHDEGTPINPEWTIEDMINFVHPETFVSLPIGAKVQADTNEAPEWLDIPHDQYQAITRSDGKIMTVAKGRYEIVQPAEGFDFINSFIDTGLVTMETAMSLFDGKTLVVTGKVKDGIAEVLKGDSIKKYILFYMGFDGSKGIGIKSPNERVVCANTLAIAQSETSKIDFSFKHTKNVRISLDKAKETVMHSLTQFKDDIDAYKYLASKKCTDSQLGDYVRAVFPQTENDDGEVSTKSENKIQHIIDLTLAQPEYEMIPAMAGTFWNAYNGVTNYLSHEYGRNSDTRTDSILFGQSANVSKRALSLAMQA